MDGYGHKMRKMYIILLRKVFCCDTHVNISSATATMGCQFLWSAGQESTSWGNMSSLLLRCICICSISRSQVVIISSSARPDIAVLNTMKMIYLKLIQQCFFSITNPLTESGHTPTGRILSPSTEWLILDDAIPEIKFEKSTEF